MATPRAIRIPRPRAPPTSEGPAPNGPSARRAFRPNVDGARRAARLFFVFALALVGLLALEAGLTSLAKGGISAGAPVLEALGLLAVAFLAYGWWITVGRAPRGAYVGGDELVVRERLGRERRFAGGDRLTTETVHRYAAGFLSHGPTELVRLKDGVQSRLYLVGQGFFSEALGRGT